MKDADGATAYFHCNLDGCFYKSPTTEGLHEHLNFAHQNSQWIRTPFSSPVDKPVLVCKIEIRLEL